VSVRVYLSLGSNIDPRRYLRAAMIELAEQFGELMVSPVYESRAVGFNGENFINLVVGMDIELPVAELSRRLRAIESAHGRVRQAAKFSSRTLDIDILTYGDAVGAIDGIELPRDEIRRYRHVIQPLADLAPNECDPLSGRRFSEISEALVSDDVQLWQIDSAWLQLA
jgi:2-amino-4-hydroxy-6-hydroxymethyldihydropteridine diphosphokinase